MFIWQVVILQQAFPRKRTSSTPALESSHPIFSSPLITRPTMNRQNQGEVPNVRSRL